jgi:hypothetical protein
MSQRGNKVFFDTYQTTPSGNDITILTNNDAAPTTFSTDDSGSLVITNDCNGITIDNGQLSGLPTSITLGPRDNFFASIESEGPYPNPNFSVYVNNSASSSLLIDSSGDTTLYGSLTVNHETNLLGNLSVSKHLLSGTTHSMSTSGSSNATSISVSGNDITGTITFNRVANQVATIKVNFDTPYLNPPVVVISALEGNSIETGYHVLSRLSTYFELRSYAANNSNQLSFSYIVIGFS